MIRICEKGIENNSIDYPFVYLDFLNNSLEERSTWYIKSSIAVNHSKTKTITIGCTE